MRGLVAAAALAALLMPGLAHAQEPVSRFDQLTSLKVGDIVRITDKQGHRTQGPLAELTGSSLKVDRTVFAAEGVRSIEKRVGSGTGKGAAIGVGVGLGVGVLGFFGCTNAGADGCAGVIPICAAIGAGAGAALGAVSSGKMLLVYRAPDKQAGQLSIAPVITPHTKAVALSFSF